MYERFTDRAYKVMQLANQEALRFNHEYIGTQHLLLGLVKEGSGVAAQVMRKFDIDMRKIRLEAEKLIRSGPDMVTMGKLPMTPAAKRVIKYAIEESEKLRHDCVDTEHILLGLLRENESVAAQILMNLGLRLDKARTIIENAIQQSNSAVSGWSEGEKERVFNELCEQAMSEQFTDRAKKVLQLASEEAKRLNHKYIATEHILLGLIKEGSGVAVQVLRNLTVDPQEVVVEIERLTRKGIGKGERATLSLTVRSKKVMEYAKEESRFLGHGYVGTEHILLGLLREDAGAAAQILMYFDLRLEELETEIVNVLSQPLDWGRKPPPPQPAGQAGKQPAALPEACPKCGQPVVRVIWGFTHVFLEDIKSGQAILGSYKTGASGPPWVCLKCSPKWSEAHNLAMQDYELQVEKEKAVAAADFEKAARCLDAQVELRHQLSVLLEELARNE